MEQFPRLTAVPNGPRIGGNVVPRPFSTLWFAENARVAPARGPLGTAVKRCEQNRQVVSLPFLSED